MKITIHKAGLMSTIQDMGRWAYLSQGIPLSGAMDALSARIANLAVGNAQADAVIEFTFANAEFGADDDLLIAYSGDGAILQAGPRALPPDRPVYLPSGTTVRLIANPEGSRTYLAIAGGFDVPEVLGSRSTYTTAALGGHEGRALRAGDKLCACGARGAVAAQWFRLLRGNEINYPNWSLARRLLLPVHRRTVRVVPAREFTWFEGKSVVDLLSTPFTVSNKSNRMGYRLEGPAIRKLTVGELLSTAVAPGTIQVTGDGRLVLLLADCQATGGYPRIAYVAAVDLPRCAQLKPGDEIFFKEISRAEAEKLYLHREDQLKKLAVALATQALTVV